MPKRAVLLVNLGSPKSTAEGDVRDYLREFLGDERVIDAPSQPWRALLLEGIILRTRPRKSAHAYAQVWTKEGSPLVVTSQRVQQKLATVLGPATPVYLAMRYGQPSIASVVARIAADGVEVRMHFEELQNIRLLFIGLLEPKKGLVNLTESEICVHESARWNVTRLPALLQFCQKLKGILSASGVGIGSDEHSNHSRATVRNGEGFLKNGDGIGGLIVRD